MINKTFEAKGIQTNCDTNTQTQIKRKQVKKLIKKNKNVKKTQIQNTTGLPSASYAGTLRGCLAGCGLLEETRLGLFSTESTDHLRLLCAACSATRSYKPD